MVAVVLIPILFGPLGVILGIVGTVKGSRGLSVTAIFVGVLGFVLGIILSAIILSFVNQR